MNAKRVSCDICQKRAISTPASKWCPHCEDGLCNKCLEHHGVSRSTALEHHGVSRSTALEHHGVSRSTALEHHGVSRSRHHIIPIENYQ